MNKEQQAIARLAERGEEVLHWWLQDGVLPEQLSLMEMECNKVDYKANHLSGTVAGDGGNDYPKFVCRKYEVCKHAVLGDGKIS